MKFDSLSGLRLVNVNEKEDEGGGIMGDNERIEVTVNDAGTVHIGFFYYRKWKFHAPSTEIENADDVLDYIERLWPDATNGSRLSAGWSKYRDRIHDEVKKALNGR